MTDEVLVDLSCLEEYADGDPEVMEELLEAFYETVTESLKSLEGNIVDGESNAWSEAAHKLKGAAGYVGAEKLRSLCAQAQDIKIASKDERQVVFRAINQQYDSVCKILEEKKG